MDPLIEEIWCHMPEIKETDEDAGIRARLNRQLVAAMGEEFAEKVWGIADEITGQQSREAFQQGFRLAGRLLLAMLS